MDIYEKPVWRPIHASATLCICFLILLTLLVVDIYSMNQQTSITKYLQDFSNKYFYNKSVSSLDFLILIFRFAVILEQ